MQAEHQPNNTLTEDDCKSESKVSNSLLNLQEQSALELEILGWLKCKNTHRALECLKTQLDWSEEFRTKFSAYTDELLNSSETYSQYLLLELALNNDPWPRIQQCCKEHFEAGRWLEGIGIYTTNHPISSKISYSDPRRIVPDDQLFACAKICLEQNNLEHAYQALIRIRNCPENHVDLVNKFLQQEEIMKAAGLVSSWEVAEFKETFCKIAINAIEQKNLNLAYVAAKAAADNFKTSTTACLNITLLAFENIYNEHRDRIDLRSGLKSIVGKFFEKTEQNKPYTIGHSLSMVNIFMAPDLYEKANISRSIIEEFGTVEDILKLAEIEIKSGLLPDNQIQRLLDLVPSTNQDKVRVEASKIETELNRLELLTNGRSAIRLTDCLNDNQGRLGQAKLVLEKILKTYDPQILTDEHVAKLIVCANACGEKLNLDLYRDIFGDQLETQIILLTKSKEDNFSNKAELVRFLNKKIPRIVLETMVAKINQMQIVLDRDDYSKALKRRIHKEIKALTNKIYEHFDHEENNNKSPFLLAEDYKFNRNIKAILSAFDLIAQDQNYISTIRGDIIRLAVSLQEACCKGTHDLHKLLIVHIQSLYSLVANAQSDK